MPSATPSSTLPVALVTGSSSGIGLSSCALLAEPGFRVVATMRDPKRSDPRLGVHVAIVEPGPVNTELVASVSRDVAGRQEPVSEPYRAMMAAYREGTTAAFARAGQSPDEVARVIVEAARAEPPHFRYVT